MPTIKHAAPETPWRRWQSFLNEVSDSDGKLDHAAVASRLQRFSPMTNVREPETIAASVMALSKGRALIKAAGNWKAGVIGDRDTPTSRARAQQWRLVITHGAFEPILRALRFAPNGPKYPGELRALCVDLYGRKEAGPEEPLPVPKKHLKALKALMDATGLNRMGDLAKFLELNRTDREYLDAWLGSEVGLTAWVDRLCISRAIRNCSAHGSLSAHKVVQLGFLPAMRQLVDDIQMLTDDVFRRLADK